MSFSALIFLYSNRLQGVVVRGLMSLLSGRVGLEFEMESISVRAGSIEIKNVSLYEPGIGPLIELEYGAVEFEVLPLFRGEFVIYHARLDGLDIVVDPEHDPQKRDARFRIERLREMFVPEWYESDDSLGLFEGVPVVSAGNIQLSSGSLVFEDQENGFHISELALGGASFASGDGEFEIDPGVLSFKISADRAAGSMASHVRYRGDLIRLSSQALRVDGFAFMIGNSLVQGAAWARYDVVPQSVESLADVEIELHIFESELFPTDIAGLISPWLPALVSDSAMEELNEYEPYGLELDLSGNMAELRLGYGEVRSQDGGFIRVGGGLRDITDTEEFRFQLEFEGEIPDFGGLIHASSNVAMLFTKGSAGTQGGSNEQVEVLRAVVADPRFPASALFSGQIEGNPAGTRSEAPVIAGKLELETTQGRVSTRAFIGSGNGSSGVWGAADTLPFELHVSSDDYRVEAFSAADYGAQTLSLDAHATGNVLDIESSEAEATLRIAGIRLPQSDTSGVPLLDAELGVSYHDRELSLTADVVEDVLDFSLNGLLRFVADEGATGEGAIELATADLAALGLRESDLQLQGDVRWSFATPSVGTGTFDVLAEELRISSDDRVATVERLHAQLSATPGLTELSVGSEILDLRYEGSIGPVALALRGVELLRLHVATVPGTSALRAVLPAWVSGEGETHAAAAIGGTDDHVKTWFELHDTQLLTGILVPELRSITPFSAGLAYDGASSQLQMNGWVPSLRYDDIELSDLSLNVVLDRESLRGNLGLAVFRSHADSVAAPLSSGDLEIHDMQVQLDVEDLVLRSEFYGGRIADEEIGSIRMSADLEDPERVGLVEFEIVDIRIAALQVLLGSDGEEVAGFVVGTGEIDPTELLLELELSLHDSISDGTLVGTYSQPDDHMNVTLEMPRLEMEYVEGFARGELEETRGYLSGDAEIQGQLAAPELSGRLQFHNVGLSLSRFGSRFEIDDQELRLSNNGVQFDDFTITDANRVPARLNGRITADFDQGNHEIELQLNTRRFRAIDTTVADNSLLYGRVLVDADARIVGLLSEATLDGEFGLRSGSNVTFVMPEQDPALDETRGTIRFVDEESSESEFANGSAVADGLESRPLVGGIEVGLNVQVDSDTQVTIVVDQAFGDRLVLRGGGQFSLAVEQSGEASLTGTYTISGGEYQLTFQNIVRRNFQILGGSNVTWVGDPLDAQVDVTAEYNLRTSPASLVGAYLTEQETASYRRALPFQVLLYLEGAMTEPEISFRLDMPAAARGALAGTVYNRLQQVNENEAERNRQAFALLVFNQFLGEEFASLDRGAAVTSGARSSAARLLSQQLNLLSTRVAPGLDLAFELESYEEIGEEGIEGRTELEVQFSQQFLDDRVRVELGGQFGLEGERQTDENTTGFAGDILVEYLITEDGRYRIRGFRRNEYQGPIEGTQASTGVALVYTRRFDRFLDLFRRPQEGDELQLPNPSFEQAGS